MFQKGISGLLLLLFVITCAFSQNSKLDKANSLFDAGDYYNANELYQKIYNNADRAEKAAMAFKIGKCYHKTGDPRTAERWYKRAVQYKYNDPLATLYLADMMKMQEKFDDATKEYSNFLNFLPGDPRGEAGKQSCIQAQEWLKKPATRFTVKPDNQFNTRENDYSPYYGKDERTLYFTSTRDAVTGKKLNGASSANFADIFVSIQDNKGVWSEPVPIAGPVNTEFDEGVASVNGNRMYYTSGKIASGKQYAVQIYTTEKINTSWGMPSILKLFNDSSVVVMHPAISPNEMTLYFVSNKDGGLGGKDIWVVKRSGTSSAWGMPQNVTGLNTDGDEMFPYCQNDSTVYFSSNRREGMGGLDIYKAIHKANGTWVVENMKTPINSCVDDFGIVFNQAGDKGFFTSSRSGGKGSDDIYSFVLPPLVFAIEGKVVNEKTDAPLGNAKVSFMGSDGIFLEQTTGADGSFLFSDLKANTDYTAIGEKQGFLKNKTSETTRGYTESKTLQMLLSLTPTNTEIELPNIEYDLNDTSLRAESMVSLDALVAILENNPNVIIELSAHTDFRGTTEYNDRLSLGRARSVVQYLIEKGIPEDRLTAVGYGENKPKVVDAKMLAKYSFLKENSVLDETYIKALPSDMEREIVHQINRRTEFKVIATNYVPKKGN